MQIQCKHERSHCSWSEYVLMNHILSPPAKQGWERDPVINNLIIIYPGALSPRNLGFSGKWYLQIMILGSRGAQCYLSGHCFLHHHFYFNTVLSVFLKFYAVHWHIRFWAHWVTWKLSHLGYLTLVFAMNLRN